MIISCSRRTDIPAFHAEWFMNRLRAGYALVENPYHAGRMSRVSLNPKDAEMIVFWSKNPRNLLEYLDEMDGLGYAYYFQYTITGYGTEWERGMPPLTERLDTFQRLSERLGPERVDWRFDPILFTPEISCRQTVERFCGLAREISGCTTRCIISFVDSYRHISRNVREMTPEEICMTAGALKEAADAYGLPLFTCCEAIDLSGFGIRHGACVDADKISRILQDPISVRKDTGQRKACGCVESVDIGSYGTCAHGCGYCYARGKSRMNRCDVQAPSLTGWPEQNTVITERKRPVIRVRQISLFEEETP